MSVAERAKEDADRDAKVAEAGREVQRKAREIADYMNRNPSARIAIDGFNGRRVNTVRSALIDAGVPAARIQTGQFGDAQQRRDSRVAVLVSN